MQLRIFILSLLFCIACELPAQHYNFHPVSGTEELPTSQCHFINQDSKGYIWISTDAGLVKYNGISFRTFSTANGLTNNTIFETAENKNGKLFYSSGNSKLGYIENDSAFILPATDTLAKCLNSGRKFIYTIGDYDENNYIISTQNGFFLLNRNKSDQLHYLPPSDSVSFWIKIINGKAYGSFYPDSPYHHILDKNNYRLCIEKNGKKTFETISLDNLGFSGQSVFKPLLLADGRLLVGFWNEIWIFSPDGNYDSIKLPAQLLSVYQDPQHEIWLGLVQDGLLYYPEGNLKSEPQHLLNELSVSGTCMDKEGGVWICTLTSGILYCPSLNVVLYPEKNLSSKLYALNYISPYVVTNALNNDIYFFSDKTHYRKKTNSSSENTKAAYAFLKRGDEILVVGSIGSFLLDTGYQIKHMIIDDSLKITTSMYNIAEGKDGKTWGIQFNYLLSIQHNTFHTDKKLPSRGRDVGVDGSGTVYVGTNNGLYLREENSLSPVKELSCKINRLKCDSSGTMWACTDGKGIAEMKDGKVIRFYNSSDGLPSGICYDIVFYNNSVWIGTNKGLCRLNLSTKPEVEVFTTSHGLISNEIEKLAIMRNELYVATPKGLCVLDIDKIHIDKIPPPVYIQNVLENNQPVRGDTCFTYEENNFTFIVEGLSYENPSGIVYRYRLNGLDTNWRSSTTGEITLNNLDDGKYTFEVIATNSDGIKSKTTATYNFTIAPPFWKTIWFFILEFLFFCGTVYGIILWRTRIIRKKESDKTQLNKMIAEYQMSAIRAKMNPHFIFNAINSIQNYILDNETQHAYDYLAKFSRLIRQVLVNSEHNLISLQTELEMLAIYIDLEQQRFSNKFEFEITIEKNVPVDEIKIPTLLIQPFVENAIWHGIMGLPKNKSGRLSIVISLEKNQLHIEIKDNGIGRKESARRKNGNGHQSMGILLSQKRMEILKAVGHENISIELVDLVDEHNSGTGTLVKIVLYLSE